MGIKSRFGGVSNAKLNERGTFLEEGEYELEIKRCSMFTARDKKTEFYLVESKVLASDNPKHPVGSDRNWMPKMGQDMTDTNLKGFIIACLGIDSSDKAGIEGVAEELPNALAESIDDPTDPDCKNALKGTVVHVTVKATTLKNGDPFNAHRFSPSKAAA